ncbi:hypothetical protein JC795_17550 [Pseudomonas veronii]|uniref:FlhC family transcriptional regulator n=1 Tax=Pseudomonas veronii TaxID=76761 RepID=UPI0018E8D1F2|nr:FlhC family transcriptional regulator [Pseudomonas veronii]MBJ2179998.1 hypothetical protein [Pseudomonas veronii]
MDESLAKTLVHVGFRSAIIRIHTGMTRKQVTSLRKREGIVGPSESGPLPNAESLLAKKEATLEASLFMLAYLITAKSPRTTIDVEAVMAAHSQYYDCHAALRNGQLDLENVLEIDDAWVIARDYRSKEVTMRSCSTCHIEFVVSINRPKHCCPLCDGVQVRDRFHCDHADRAVSKRSVAELIELSQKVTQWENWGYSPSEIQKELGISQKEFDACTKLQGFTDPQLQGVLDKYTSGDSLVKALMKGSRSRPVHLKVL